MNRDELLEAVYTAYEDRYEKPMYPPYAELAVDTILEEINEGVTEEWCRGKGAWVTARMRAVELHDQGFVVLDVITGTDDRDGPVSILRYAKGTGARITAEKTEAETS